MSDLPTLERCTHCRAMVAPANLARHLRRQHPTTEQIAENVERINLEAKREAEKFFGQRTQCTECNLKIRFDEIKSHFGNVHSKPAPARLLAFLGESAPANRFRSGRERETFWRDVDGIPRPEESEDLFDRTKVLSGGAFGLGRRGKR